MCRIDIRPVKHNFEGWGLVEYVYFYRNFFTIFVSFIILYKSMILLFFFLKFEKKPSPRDVQRFKLSFTMPVW